MYTVLMVLNGLMGILMVWMSLTLVFQLIVSVFDSRAAYLQRC